MDNMHTDVRVQKVNLIICQRLSESLKRSVFVIISRILRIHFTKKQFYNSNYHNMLEKHRRRNTPLRRPKHSSSVEFTETDSGMNMEKITRLDRKNLFRKKKKNVSAIDVGAMGKLPVDTPKQKLTFFYRRKSKQKKPR